MSEQAGNGTRWLVRRLDELAGELGRVRDRVHDIANAVQPVVDQERRIALLEERTENVNVTERDVRDLKEGQKRLEDRMNALIHALVVASLTFAVGSAGVALSIFLAFR